MKHRIGPLQLLLLLAVLLLATPTQLAAYIDPGSGSFFVQMLVAGVLGGLVTLKTFWKQVKSYFSRSNSSPQK
jgi:fluoride ion exporter CrcB/FEX